MNPLSLHLQNVGRFAELDLDLPNGCVAVAGPNGAGKSTVLNAIELALFANGSRDLAGRLGPYGDRLTLELVFEHGGRTYRVRRGYRAGGRGGTATLDFERQWSSATENGHGLNASTAHSEGFEPLTLETAAETQTLICDTLGLSRQTFNASSFLGQGNAGHFPNAPAADRKALLGEILDPRRVWPRLAERARVDLRAVEASVAGISARVVERERQVADAEKVAIDLALADSAVAAALEWVELEKEHLEYAQAAQAANAAAAERDFAINAAADAVRRERAAADKHADDLDRMAAKIRETGERDGQRLMQLIRDHSQLAAAPANERHCDVCGSALTDETHATRIAKMREQITALEQGCSELANELLFVEVQAKAAKQDALQIVPPTVTATPSLTDDRKLAEAVAAARRNLDQRTEQLTAAERHAARLEQQAEQLRDATVELADLRSDLAAQQDRADLLRLADRAFGRDGVPALLVEAIVPQIEAEANRILQQMPTADGGIYRVELHTQRALKGDTSQIRETLDVVVADADGGRDLDTYSGGERARINIALRIALERLLAHRRGAESRVLCVDELEYLDEIGQERLVDVVRGVAGDFDKCLVVSHSSAVRDAFDHTIEVAKTDGVSHVVAPVGEIAVTV
jgi:DNA repair exonuclease SbcCD ATPase subunit